MRAGALTAHLSYANVMATVAVFLALGGSAYAVKRINGKDITPRSVPAGKLKRDALTREEIGPRAIGRSELSRGLRAALRPADDEPLFPSDPGFPSEPGLPGEPGEPGPPGTACDPAGARLCPEDELPAGWTLRLTVTGFSAEVRPDPAYRAGCTTTTPPCTLLLRGALPVPADVDAWVRAGNNQRGLQLFVERSGGAIVTQLNGSNGRVVSLVRHGELWHLTLAADALAPPAP